jgi:hypothetical protein
MRLYRLIGVLTILAASFGMEPPAHAFCDVSNPDSCGACMVCNENARCVQPACVPSGCVDDVLYNTNCCSGAAVPGSTHCSNPADYGTTWASCTQICA